MLFLDKFHIVFCYPFARPVKCFKSRHLFVGFFGLYVQIPWIFIWYVWFSVKCPLTLSTLKVVLNWVWWQIAVCRTNLACVSKVRERLLNQVGTGMNSLIWAIDEELKLSLPLPALWVPSTISCLYSWLRTACPAWRLLRTSSFPLIPLKKQGWSFVKGFYCAAFRPGKTQPFLTHRSTVG